MSYRLLLAVLRNPCARNEEQDEEDRKEQPRLIHSKLQAPLTTHTLSEPTYNKITKQTLQPTNSLYVYKWGFNRVFGNLSHTLPHTTQHYTHYTPARLPTQFQFFAASVHDSSHDAEARCAHGAEVSCVKESCAKEMKSGRPTQNDHHHHLQLICIRR